MAAGGVDPKAVKHGRTPNLDWTDVPNIPYHDGRQRELGKKPTRAQWRDQVVEWWDLVRVMPHCKNWTETDWMFARQTAVQWQMVWLDMEDGKVQTTMLTEIRRREDVMGITAEARRKMRIRYVDPPAEQAAAATDDDGESTGGATVTNIKDRKAKIA